MKRLLLLGLLCLLGASLLWGSFRRHERMKLVLWQICEQSIVNDPVKQFRSYMRDESHEWYGHDWCDTVLGKL